MVYIGFETGDSGAKLVRAVVEHAVRAGYLGGRAVVMSTCASACLPAETQLVQVFFELAVLADYFGGRVVVVSASACRILTVDRMDPLL